jgi:endoglucanase
MWSLLAGGLVVALIAGALAWYFHDDAGGDGSGPDAVAADTQSDSPFYVVPTSNAAKQVAAWEKDGRTGDVNVIKKIADQPMAVWFAYDGPDLAAKATQLVADAAKVGKIPVLTAYYVPDRDCGQYSSGGAPDADAYRAWIRKLATATAGHAAYVILEPDAVAHTLDGCLSDEDVISQRYALLNDAITTLKTNPRVKVYLDAGNAAWVHGDQMGPALRQAGIAKADGFALNVANFQTTAASITYGSAVSAATGGKHFVIDTSRNGNGPAQNKGDDSHWCNPPGRKIGAAPTTKTGNPLVDALLWIKGPGDSDGACRDGAPAAGAWWPEYALELAR